MQVSMVVRIFAMKTGSVATCDLWQVRLKEIVSRQDWRLAVRRELGLKNYFGGGGEIVQVMHHGIDGEWDRDYLADSAVQVFVRSAAAFGIFQVKHHSFFCAGGGEGRKFAKEEGGDFFVESGRSQIKFP